MASESIQPFDKASGFNKRFQFMDLPGRARAEIYHILLSSFGPNPVKRTAGTMVGSAQKVGIIGSSIHPEILRTCKKIHDEALEIMIATNEFVRIRATGGVPLMDLISREGIPVVANDPARIQRFRGCALSLALVKKYKPRQDLSYDDSDQHNYGFLLPRQAEILILGRDMQAFCKGFANSNMAPPGSNNLVVSIRVAPVVEDIPGWRTDSLIAWFRSYGTQQYLLYPLQQYLRGMNDLRVFGKVFDDLHAAAAANMAQAQTREESIIYRATFANKRGNSFFERHKYPQACSIWRDAIVEIEDLRRSDEWNHFLEDEAKNVVGNLAKLYFAMHMNIAHAELQRSMVDPTMHYSSLAFANRALDKARKAMSSDFWGPELIWNAEPYHKAALLCKKATYLRLEGIELDKAMYYLEKALVYSPGDAEILWEQGEVSRLQEIELQDSQNTEA